MEDCKAAVVALISKAGKVLIIKRKEKPGDPWSGHMALPGGRREDHEECESTAVRECYEEVRIKPQNLIRVGIYSPNNAPDMKVSAYISCVEEELEPIVQEEELEKAIWVKISDLKPADRAFYYENYRIWGMTYRILNDIIQKKLYLVCQSGNNSS
ncbi:NUDIX hydrolase [Sulfolobus acidocaldarius SUSAZ]|nr:NUDIX hydrolase [Sulfolobus acidocaldarius SUSAZ]